jgi:16S rRNA (cytidine1402-2'-O)-methyltransferase
VSDERPISGTLYVVPTPIGDERDLSPRAREVLAAVDLIAAEDTRHAMTLLSAIGIKKPLHSYFDHNEAERAPWLVGKLEAGQSVALISDAGTPLINDPGFRIVRLAIERGLPLVVLPGPCAAVTALVASGLATDAFLFAGFLPRAEGQRARRLEELRGLDATLLFYEAPHRLIEMLATAQQVLGDRAAAVAMSLTKSREEVLRGPLSSLLSQLRARDRVGGEVTVAIAGAGERGGDVLKAEAHARALLDAGLEPRRVRDLVAAAFELPRRAVYDIVLRLAGSSDHGGSSDDSGSGDDGSDSDSGDDSGSGDGGSDSGDDSGGA